MERSKIVSRIAGSGILAFNIIFLLPSEMMYQGWKLFENGLIVFTLLWIIPAIATWVSKNRTDFYLCLLNLFGFGWSMFVLFISFFKPRVIPEQCIYQKSSRFYHSLRSGSDWNFCQPN
jgi:hypothetical protein